MVSAQQVWFKRKRWYPHHTDCIYYSTEASWVFFFAKGKSTTTISMLYPTVHHTRSPRGLFNHHANRLFSLTLHHRNGEADFFSSKNPFSLHWWAGIFFTQAQNSMNSMFCPATTRALLVCRLKGDARNSLCRQTTWKRTRRAGTFSEPGHTTHNRYNIRPYPEKAAAFNSNTARWLQTGRVYKYRLQRGAEKTRNKRERITQL
jgi:hypothetical protein